MVVSFKGFAINFCLVVLFTAASVFAQDTTATNFQRESDRPTDILRIKSAPDTTKVGPRDLAHLATHPAPYSTLRKAIHTTNEIEDEPKADLFAAAENAEDEAGVIVTLNAPQWGLGDLRKHLKEEIRFPSPVEMKLDREAADDPDDPTPAPPRDKFHWRPAIYQSLIAQGFQHGYALIVQEKTRRALKGPFFRDYWESVKGVRGWSDGNKFFTNYIAHPMQGSMTGFIYAQNHDRVRKQMFNESKQYWKDRARALVWSAAWSTNWEIGPISQSTIGNVGLYGKQGYVDLVITPTVGTAWMITEEALDRYIIRHAEENLAARIILRTVLNPTRSVANMLRFKKPWYRDRAN